MEDQRLGQRGAHELNTIAAQTKINMAAVYPLMVQAPPVAQHTPKPSDAKPKPNCDAIFWMVVTVGSIYILLTCIGIYLDQHYVPRPPIFHLHSLSINVSPPFNVSHVNTTHVMSSWNVSFNVRNPNRFAKIIHKEAINVSVFYKDLNLSSSSTVAVAAISPFHQLTKDERSLEALSSPVSVANDILVEDWSKNGGVTNFTVTIDDVFVLTSRPVYVDELWNMRVTCKDVTVQFSSDNTTAAGTSMLGDSSKQCKIQYCKKLKYHPK